MTYVRPGFFTIVAIAIFHITPAFAAPLGSSITYQGQLKVGGSPAAGPVDMEFRLFDALDGGNQVGPTLTFNGAGGNPAPINVTNGLFTVQLDFTSVAYSGDKRWLEITVGGTPLTPRQELTAAPHARFAAAPWKSNGTNISYTDGNVGIGTASPGYPLNFTSTVGDKISLYGATGPHYGFGIQGSRLQIHTDQVTSDVLFGYGTSTDMVETMRIKGNGNVGIGLTNPGARLHVSDSSNFPARFDSSSPGGTWFSLKNTSPGGNDWNFISTCNGNGEGPGKLLFKNNNTFAIALTLDSNGDAEVARWLSLGLGGIRKGGNPITTTNDMGLYSLTSGEWLRIVSNGGNIAFYNNASVGTGVTAGKPTMLIESNRFVSMNLNSASAALHVFHPDSNGQNTIMAESTAPGGTWIRAKNNSLGGHDWAIISTGSANGEGAGQLVFRDTTSNKVALTLQNDGDAIVSVLEITGGSDIAEPFNINGEKSSNDDEVTSQIQPGMVVCIDPERIGEMTLSTKQYDCTVAGVISGAGGVKPGMMLRQTDTVADGKHPVALTGRVYCWVNADAGGPVKAGDLLTTSVTPGHAMKVGDRDQAQGAILGKAMSSLAAGKGLVLILVTLQ